MRLKTMTSSAVAAALALSMQTAPLSVAPAAAQVAGDPGVHLTRSRGWHGPRHGWRHGHRHGGRWIGPAIGAGIAALIIGGSIAAARANHGDRWAQCADEYRSFDPSDGTFQPYGGGPRELCPYLRG